MEVVNTLFSFSRNRQCGDESKGLASDRRGDEDRYVFHVKHLFLWGLTALITAAKRRRRHRAIGSNYTDVIRKHLRSDQRSDGGFIYDFQRLGAPLSRAPGTEDVLALCGGFF